MFANPAHYHDVQHQFQIILDINPVRSYPHTNTEVRWNLRVWLRFFRRQRLPHATLLQAGWCTKGGRDACEHAQVCVCERVRVALIHGPSRSHAARSHSHHHHRLAHAGFCCNDAGRPAFFFVCWRKTQLHCAFFPSSSPLFMVTYFVVCEKCSCASHIHTHTQCSANSSCVCGREGERASIQCIALNCIVFSPAQARVCRCFVLFFFLRLFILYPSLPSFHHPGILVGVCVGG